MKKLPTLFVHIGAGKTGSTSIQRTLQENQDTLTAEGVAYFGLMLEEVPGARKHTWCVTGLPQAFFYADDKEKADREVCETVLAALHNAAENGIDRVIWSNEAFLNRANRIIPILKRIQSTNVAVIPICYLRRHDAWAQSGFVQFGIKYKTYDGPQRTFEQWKHDVDLAFAPDVERWIDAFFNTELYNFDAIDDVTQHLLARIGAGPLETNRANDRPNSALLAAWTVFNQRIQGRAMPRVFHKFATALRVMPQQTPTTPPLTDLLPSQDALDLVREEFREDAEKINVILESQGQQPLELDRLQVDAKDPSPWELNAMLLTMVFSLQQQIFRLEERLDALDKSKNKSD